MDAVIPYLQQNGGGSIVNCGSTSALRGMGANAYTASQFSCRNIIIRGACNKCVFPYLNMPRLF